MQDKSQDHKNYSLRSPFKKRQQEELNVDHYAKDEACFAKKKLKVSSSAEELLDEHSMEVARIELPDRYDLAFYQDIERLEKEYDIQYIRTHNLEHRSLERKLIIAPVSLIKIPENNTKMLGVFAKQDLVVEPRKQLVMGIYLGKISEAKDSNTESVYVFETPDGHCIDGEKECTWLAKVNTTLSKETANVHTRWSNCGIEYYIDGGKNGILISAGEQLLVYYGDEFHHNISNKDGLRFLRKTDDSRDSWDIHRDYQSQYKIIGETLNPAFLSLLGKKTRNYFFVPLLKEEYFDKKPYFPDLPLLESYSTDGQTNVTFYPQYEQENMTLLMLFCWAGNEAVVTTLLENGADPNIQSSITGQSVAHFIVRSQLTVEVKIKFLQLLSAYQYPLHLTLQDKSNNSILHYAVQNQEPILVSFLIAQDPDLLLCLNDERSDHTEHYDPFALAIRIGNKSVIKCFLDYFQTLRMLKLRHSLSDYLSRNAPSEIGSSFLVNEFKMLFSNSFNKKSPESSISTKEKIIALNMVVNFFKEKLKLLKNPSKKIKEWTEELKIIEQLVEKKSEFKKKSAPKNAFFKPIDPVPDGASGLNLLVLYARRVSRLDFLIQWQKIEKMIEFIYASWYSPHIVKIPVDTTTQQYKVIFQIISQDIVNRSAGFEDSLVYWNKFHLKLRITSIDNFLFNEKLEAVQKFKSLILKEINSDISIDIALKNIVSDIDHAQCKKSYYYFVYKCAVEKAKLSLGHEDEKQSIHILHQLTQELLKIDHAYVCFMMSILINELDRAITSKTIERYFYVDSTLNIIINQVYINFYFRINAANENQDPQQHELRMMFNELNIYFDQKQQMLEELADSIAFEHLIVGSRNNLALA